MSSNTSSTASTSSDSTRSTADDIGVNIDDDALSTSTTRNSDVVDAVSVFRTMNLYRPHTNTRTHS